MRISAKAQYACLAVIELAKSGDGLPQRVREIAKAQRIPERYLIQILLHLKAAGLVQSARGSEGGYNLARRPEEISIAEVIAVVEGRDEAPRRSETGAALKLCELLERARSAERAVLASTSIAELAETNSPHDWVL
jgi:Rrf2 family transcriptional regulator, cysteine metabolism repressor